MITIKINIVKYTNRLYESVIVNTEYRNFFHWINLVKFIRMLFSIVFYQINRLYVVWYLL